MTMLDVAARTDEVTARSATAVRNALFIMCDELRWDYLSCAGHPTLQTPNIDWLATRGVRFDRAYVQGPVCGSSRMSYYTGRYITSHGAVWNFVPLSVSQLTLGDFVRPHGIRCAVVGKTHVEPDRAGMARLSLDPNVGTGALVAQGGFEPVARDDGTWPGAFIADERSPYTRYLRSRGYHSDNPWHDFANSSLGSDGSILSGWEMRHARRPARIAREDSETAYTTDRGIDFIREQGDQPWCLHVSYIKPHWPYVAPAPYNAIYGPGDILPVKQSAREREAGHPVVERYRDFVHAINQSRPNVRQTIIPTYMGLIREVDDHIGRLTAALRECGQLENTLIIFCSDHGDYLGDHYLGEKELFHDASSRVPLIVVDPRAHADGTRGNVSVDLVEAIDVVPTILDGLGIRCPEHILEGRSLIPRVRGDDTSWRNAAFSENTYAFHDSVRLPLGRAIDGCRHFMVRTQRWKYNVYDGFAPELFDLDNDPDEFVDLSREPAYAPVCAELQELFQEWLRSRAIHTTLANERIAEFSARVNSAGIVIGAW